ncbi:MAG TPA: methyltransferase [Bacteroidales bacterium]|nr:methyltransferase [Bacteroidales bacterium]HPS26547.1 methyltransferase [Bacteroidales bacterium]
MKPAFKITTPEQLRDVLFGFRVSRVILTAFELDLFTLLGSEGSCSATVARKIHADARATDRVLNALCAIGLVKKYKGMFFHTAFSAKYLSKKSPDYLYGLMHTANMWDTWSTMTEMVRTGKSQRNRIPARSEAEWSEAFISAMHERAAQQAKNVLDKINLQGIRHFLDIGGGSGVYAMDFVKRSTDNMATVFDLPGIITITKKYVKKESLLKRFSFIGGDYNKDSLGAGYDLAFLSAIVHINSLEQNQVLVNKCFGALNPGGIIAIQDHVMDEDRTAPFSGAMFAMNMLVATDCGDTYTAKEIKTWLRNAGFVDIKKTETYNNAMITGRKPAKKIRNTK